MRAKEHSSIFFQNLNGEKVGLNEALCFKDGEIVRLDEALCCGGGVPTLISNSRIDCKSCSFVSSNAVRAGFFRISSILLQVHR